MLQWQIDLPGLCHVSSTSQHGALSLQREFHSVELLAVFSDFADKRILDTAQQSSGLPAMYTGPRFRTITGANTKQNSASSSLVAFLSSRVLKREHF
jgi:hypothetical protein